MRFFLLALLCTCSLHSVETTVNVSQGYRKDKLKFSISGPHHKPNILSELTFKNIQIYQSRISSKVQHDKYFGILQLGYGKIFDGKVQDSDYFLNNRHLEFSRSISHIRGSYTFDGSLAFGVETALSPKTKLYPQVGYTWDIQDYHIKDGTQKITPSKKGIHKTDKKIRGLNSRYKASWDGPFIGMKIRNEVHPQVTLYGEADLFFALKYHAKAHWNLRDDLKGPFTQDSKRSKGYGASLVVGGSYEFLKNWSLNLEGSLLHFAAHGGKDVKKLRHETIHLPFRKAELTSTEVRLCLEYTF